MPSTMKYFSLFAIISPLLFACTDSKEKIYPEKLPMTESVYASATVQPDSLYQVYSVAMGILDKIWVAVFVGIWLVYKNVAKSADNISKDSPLEILKKRYAKGEITKEEFEDIKKQLS